MITNEELKVIAPSVIFREEINGILIVITNPKGTREIDNYLYFVTLQKK